MIWLIFTVLKDNRKPYPELGEDEEWGYRDKPKNQSTDPNSDEKLPHLMP
ncbi:hypothetical protein ADIARSV_3519 [Arcticibacter svalbardensis MN12-7]|uniref:Uncharacterized protein n=2 Tax=Arcticibacter TaxID=1288026 RepID=R9GNL1_9SPHI|nr:hypothetical protein ADIARSV_3519 [Arcticibacter svalbardensis MN12-7]